MRSNKFAAYVSIAIPWISVVGLFVWGGGIEWWSEDIVIPGDTIYDFLVFIGLIETWLGSSILGSMADTSLKDKNKLNNLNHIWSIR